MHKCTNAHWRERWGARGRTAAASPYSLRSSCGSCPVFPRAFLADYLFVCFGRANRTGGNGELYRLYMRIMQNKDQRMGKRKNEKHEEQYFDRREVIFATGNAAIRVLVGLLARGKGGGVLEGQVLFDAPLRRLC